MSKIAKYMSPDRVLFLNSKTRDEALNALIDALDASKKLLDRSAFSEAIYYREGIVSTGIGMGVAIPHAKLPWDGDFFIAVGILSKGIEWKALDDVPVRLIFMIGGPDDKQTEYLQILSNLTMEIRDEERRKKVLTLNSKEAIIQLFNSR